MRIKLICLALASALSAILTVSAFAQEKNLKAFSPAELTQRTLHRRAVEAVIWGMPAVNAELMFQAMPTPRPTSTRSSIGRGRSTGRTRRSRPTRTRSISCRSTTPRMPGRWCWRFRRRRRGDSITGSIDDAWQTALEDVGPAGVDKGKGGKYLILPPGYKDKPPDGYIALAVSDLRRLRDPALQPQERQRRRYRQGRRLRQARSSSIRSRRPPILHRRRSSMRSTSCSTARFPTTCASSRRSTASCKREPWLERDKVMIDQLKTIGIEKGKPFNPDAKTQKILDRRRARSACLARSASTKASSRRRSTKAPTGRCPRSPGVAEGMMTNFANPNAYPVDGRGVTYSMALLQRQASRRGPVLPDDDQGQGRPAVRRRQTYRLTVPPNAPVKLYWSATVYDRATHALIRELDVVEPLVATRRDCRRTPTVRWISTSARRHRRARSRTGSRPSADGKFEVLFRFYGPEKPLFDKTWKLPDIEKVK